MSRILLAAAFLAALTAAVHIFAGGMEVAAPLLASALEPELKFTLYGVWHLLTRPGEDWLLKLPQWGLLLPVGALALVGGSRPALPSTGSTGGGAGG